MQFVASVVMSESEIKKSDQDDNDIQELIAICDHCGQLLKNLPTPGQDKGQSFAYGVLTVYGDCDGSCDDADNEPFFELDI